MKYALILILATSSCIFAQEGGNAVFYQNAGAVAGPVTVTGGAIAAFEKAPGTPVQGAPYAATIVNESVQTLPDGNRIVQKSTGTTARDSLGRTRRDAALPAIGSLSAANPPHLVFIQDPVSQTSYTLNLTDKTAQKMSVFPLAAGGATQAGGSDTFFFQTGGVQMGGPLAPLPPSTIATQKGLVTNEQVQVSTEDLGSQTMEGVLVKGVRTTRTIPAGQIGNDKPIDIVTEVWTSPELKTIVSSKRSDPRMGDQTFLLTNIVRVEPDPALFTVPADFKVIDGPQPILYRRNQ